MDASRLVMKNSKALLVTAFVFTLVLSACKDDGYVGPDTNDNSLAPGTADLDRGYNLYQRHCSNCHDNDAKGNDQQGAPDISNVSHANQIEQSIQQVVAMNGLATQLSYADMVDIAGWIDSLSAPQNTVDINNGADLYSSFCLNCHGEEARGIETKTAAEIEQAFQTIPEMNSLESQLTYNDRVDISAWLQTQHHIANAENGARLYTNYCLQCHGEEVRDIDTPPSAEQIEIAIQTNDPMNSLNSILSYDDMLDLSAWLETQIHVADVSNGADLYANICSDCHTEGLQAQNANEIDAAIQNIDSMGSLISQITYDDMLDIAAWIEKQQQNNGAVLYANHCTSCHDEDASDLKNQNAEQIKEAIEGVAQMKNLNSLLTSDDMADIAAWFSSLQ